MPHRSLSAVAVRSCSGGWCLTFIKAISEGQSGLSSIPSYVLWVQAQFQLSEVDNNAHLQGLWGGRGVMTYLEGRRSSKKIFPLLVGSS